MQSEIIFLLIGLLFGALSTWIIFRLATKSKTVSHAVYNELTEKLIELNNEFSVEKEKVRSLAESLRINDEQLKFQIHENLTINGQLASKSTELAGFKNNFEELKSEFVEEKANNLKLNTSLHELNSILSTANAKSEYLNEQYRKSKEDLSAEKLNVSNLNTDNQKLNKNLSSTLASLDALKSIEKKLNTDLIQLKTDLATKTDEYNEVNKQHAQLTANNLALQEKLDTQKKEIQELRERFNTDFENIATKIFDNKSEKFTKLNKDNIETLLKPLGENLDTFKKKVEEVYDMESKERFALGKEVEKLVKLNQQVSEEANNLTNALTSNAKNQGDWGQIILESILEKSGLASGREYFIQEFLKDEDGNYLLNEDGKKMQPDVIIRYPDNRKLIVDSKVSLTAYNRYSSSKTKEDDAKALAEHLKSIKKHIDDLSSKNYQDFAPSLDFVMMFVPVEPAYLIAIHIDQDLWNYAYNKRILLTSPSNLIVALKMIVDLWKKDNQSKNYKDIVIRAGKMYDKVFNVVESLQLVGKSLKGAQVHYNTTISRLSEGSDNLIKQFDKMKELGANVKSTLPDPDNLLVIDIDMGVKLTEESLNG